MSFLLTFLIVAAACYVLGLLLMVLPRLGSAGRDFVKIAFDKDRLIADIEGLYEHCLGRAQIR